jgi:hypothetical protein
LKEFSKEELITIIEIALKKQDLVYAIEALQELEAILPPPQVGAEKPSGIQNDYAEPPSSVDELSPSLKRSWAVNRSASVKRVKKFKEAHVVGDELYCSCLIPLQEEDEGTFLFDWDKFYSKICSSDRYTPQCRKMAKILFDIGSRKGLYEKNGTYCEWHHILPICMGGALSFQNTVRLSFEDHTRAHIALAYFWDIGGLHDGLRLMINKTKCYSKMQLVRMSEDKVRVMIFSHNQPTAMRSADPFCSHTFYIPDNV